MQCQSLCGKLILTHTHVVKYTAKMIVACTASNLEHCDNTKSGGNVRADISSAVSRGFVGADCTATITEAALECVSEAVTEAQAAVSGAELTEEELQVLTAEMDPPPGCLYILLTQFLDPNCGGFLPMLIHV